MDFFADSPSQSSSPKPAPHLVPPWCVLVVDDDAEVHAVTRLALSGFEFQGRPLELLSAYSATQAREIFKTRDDIALALIDVVMETEHAGLDLVRYLRETCSNRMTRLVLRTGQAGQAPEDRVIREYEVDDYKEKTELTTQKLRTLLYSMLRAYRDLGVIEAQREGLSHVLDACAKVQNADTLKVFSSTVLEQLTSLLHLGRSALYCVICPGEGHHETRTLAATGEFHSYQSDDSLGSLPDEVAERLRQVLEAKESFHYDDAYVLYHCNERGGSSVLYVTHLEPLSELDRQLLEIYMRNVAITFENINLLEDLQETSKELVYTLANAVEARSKETGAHVQRVSLFGEMLARLYGLPDKEIYLIQHASPLHDIGKVVIPDAILHKPGKLDADEWAVMKKHVDYGVAILQRSRRVLMQVGAQIAGNHHERWDGNGYPGGLAGESIPLAGRIIALADVFDALCSRRSYKEPWSREQVLELIRSERGRHFEPKLVDLLLEHQDEFFAIRERYPDESDEHPS
ncbi:DUF3369 domain-containing protein [Metapseudomonas otitidis]|uniref:DUF3369 domain-containing protein n=1 Tax=Metapseudomonas otitidis TaxID=319939 RepID=UPI0013F6339A|nr:DUF3369 domain-containing protein [Pseudomonas otitidis]